MESRLEYKNSGFSNAQERLNDPTVQNTEKEKLPTPEEAIQDLADRLDLPVEQMAADADVAAYENSSPDGKLRAAYSLLPVDIRARIEGQAPDQLRNRMGILRTKGRQLMPALQATLLAFMLGGCGLKGQKSRVPEKTSEISQKFNKEQVPAIPEKIESYEQYTALHEQIQAYYMAQFSKADDEKSERFQAAQDKWSEAVQKAEDEYYNKETNTDDLEASRKIKEQHYRQLEAEKDRLSKEKEAAEDKAGKDFDTITDKFQAERDKLVLQLDKAINLTFSLSDIRSKWEKLYRSEKRSVDEPYVRWTVNDAVESLHRWKVNQTLAQWLGDHKGASIDVEEFGMELPKGGSEITPIATKITLKITEQGKSPVTVTGKAGPAKDLGALYLIAAERALTEYAEK